MREGNIEQIGTPEELYTTPATPFVAAFVGLSNRMPAILSDKRITLYGETLEVLGSPGTTGPVDGPVLAFVRPEDLLLVPSSTPGSIAAVVVDTSFLGSLRRTRLRLSDGTMVSVQHDVSERPQPGETVGVRLRGTAVSVSEIDN